MTFKADLLKDLTDRMDPLEDVFDLINISVNDDPPVTVREGNIIKNGYNGQVDLLRKAKTEGKNWLADLEEKEKEKTGIKNLKIKYNRVFGYYFEVTNAFKDKVPDYFIRKQTLTNAERYTSDELQKLEESILGAEDKLLTLEYDLFSEVREKVSKEVLRIQQTARAVAEADCLSSLAEAAEKYGYVRPSVNKKGTIEIRDGRHPVVERMMDSGSFIPNDTVLDEGKNRISIITGPNMAGKSTYMRQTALIVLMAQMGSFVPAGEADIGICDRIFTRVGASDDLSSGQSTFMVEMTEVANILRNATRESLVILDEIGRGTSTFDGLSIAWAVVEHISNPRLIGAKTLFATHYHELTELEGTLNGVNNYCVAVKEQGDDIVFLRKIVKGGADKSYGIQVAKLAGVPEQVIERAKELLEDLSCADIATRAAEIARLEPSGKNRMVPDTQKENDESQLSLFDKPEKSDVLKEIESIDLTKTTPIEALNILSEIQEKIRNEGS
jgi:DNA mismatch repair protein MutS